MADSVVAGWLAELSLQDLIPTFRDEGVRFLLSEMRDPCPRSEANSAAEPHFPRSRVGLCILEKGTA